MVSNSGGGGIRAARWACALALVWACASGGDGDDDTMRRDGGPIVDEDGDRIPAEMDCDDNDRTIGTSGERACSSACAVGVERCTDGVFSECTAPASCTCDAADPPRVRDCAMCGMVTDTCVDDAWVPGECEDQGMCAPGELDMRTHAGAGCGECRVEQKTCTAECGWPETWECIDMAPDCNFWLLPNGATAWSAYHLADNPFSPTDPIRGAFPLEGESEGWVLTDTRLHRFRLGCAPSESDPCWSGMDNLSAKFGSELDGYTLQYAGTIPASFTGTTQTIDVFSETHDTRYHRALGTETLMNEWNNPRPTGPPMDPEAADRAEIVANWTDIGNTNGWVSIPCEGTAGMVDGYIATIAADQVSIFAACGTMLQGHVQIGPFADFPPFTLPGAPEFGDVAAAFYDGGLYVFAAD